VLTLSHRRPPSPTRRATCNLGGHAFPFGASSVSTTLPVLRSMRWAVLYVRGMASLLKTHTKAVRQTVPVCLAANCAQRIHRGLCIETPMYPRTPGNFHTQNCPSFVFVFITSSFQVPRGQSVGWSISEAPLPRRIMLGPGHRQTPGEASRAGLPDNCCRRLTGLSPILPSLPAIRLPCKVQ